jgi:hypothetical protein
MRFSQPNTGIWLSASTDQGRSSKPTLQVDRDAHFELVFIFTQGRFVGLLRLARAKTVHKWLTWRSSSATIIPILPRLPNHPDLAAILD